MKKLGGVLCRAFEGDAHINWIVRQDSRRGKALRELFRLLLTDLLGPRGEVYATPDRLGVAIWFPPAAWRLSVVEQAQVALRFASITGWSRLPWRIVGIRRMEDKHPNVPHYFLQTIGVDPEAQGQGYGSSLMGPVLKRCDAQGLHAYLETSNPRNLDFYAKRGFHVHAEAPLPGGPLLWQMLRPPTRT